MDIDHSYYQNGNGQNIDPKPKDTRFEFKALFFLFLRNWYWLVLGLSVGVFIAWLQLRYATTVYQVRGTVLINEEEKQPISEDIIAQDLGFKSRSNIQDEIQILKSSGLMERVVDSLKLNIQYFQKGRIKTSEQYGNPSIFLEDVKPMEQAYGKSITLRTIDEQDFVLVRGENDTLVCRYGTPFTFNGVEYKIGFNFNPNPGTEFVVKIRNPKNTARSYASRLKLTPIGRSNVIAMSLQDAVPHRASLALRTLIQEYNSSVIEKENLSGQQTLNFIDDRLAFINGELINVEKKVEGFKQSNELPVELGTRASQYLDQFNEVDKQLVEFQLQEGLLENMTNFIEADSNRYQPLPASSEILSGTLSELVLEYNKILFERDQFLEAATIKNPVVSTYEERLNYLRGNIMLSIGTLKQEIQERKKRMEARVEPIQKQINAIPSKERRLLQIMREQQVQEQLYLYLLQKRLETALSIAAQTANSRILDEPINVGAVAPNRSRIQMMSLLLGLGIPAGIIFLLYYFDDKIYHQKDIQLVTKAPFLGTIASAKKKTPIVIKKSSRSSVAEMFRLLRTNLQYLAAGQENQIILVTSSISGEGKSFISINLGISISLANKKVALIGMDLRKPKMSQYLTGQKSTLGITNFLVGEASLPEIVQRVEEYENLDFIGSGPIPPNPAELLISPPMDTLFKYLKANYDYIIIDTSPVGLVTDALLLADRVDQTILVTRFGRTTSNLLQMVDDIYRKRKLPKLGVLLNGVKASRGYGNTYGYGYGGYSYGYGYGYYEDDNRRGILDKILRKNK